MSRDKQIEEIASIIAKNEDLCRSATIASAIYNAGYRKASDVAREIFEEIEQEIEAALTSNYNAKQEHYDSRYRISTEFIGMVCGKIDALRGMQDFLANLKKKYESEGAE